MAEGKWKQIHHNHKKSFNHKPYSHETTLSNSLKETLDVTPNLKWSVVVPLYEKLVIITYPRQHELLNKRSELFSKSRHGNKYILKNFRVTKYSH